MFGLMPRRRESRSERAMARREPTPFDLLRREFASLFERAFPAWPVLFEPPWGMTEPRELELEEREGEVVVRAEVPGFEANELDVQLLNNLLTIRAERREGAEGKEAERRLARLERTVTLPAGIVPERIEARHHNGVLEVHVPRTPEAQPRRIEVRT